MQQSFWNFDKIRISCRISDDIAIGRRYRENLFWGRAAAPAGVKPEDSSTLPCISHPPSLSDARVKPISQQFSQLHLSPSLSLAGAFLPPLQFVY